MFTLKILSSYHSKYKRQYLKVALVLCIISLTYIFLSSEAYVPNWYWYRIRNYIITPTGSPGLLLQGLLTTIYIVTIALFLSIFFGLLAVFLSLSKWLSFRIIAQIYINTIRNTPLVIQLFIVYFLFAPVLKLTPFWSAVLTLSLFEGAYMAEIFRAGLFSIPLTQWEASYSIGFNTITALTKIILPQALKNCLTPLIGQIVSLIKDSSLVSIIAVTDLTMRAQEIIAETFLPFEIWSIVGCIYLSMALCISIAAYKIEAHFNEKYTAGSSL